MTGISMLGHCNTVNATTNRVTDKCKCGRYWYVADDIMEFTRRYLGGSNCMVSATGATSIIETDLG